MPKLLLTGSSGFVASNLYTALHQDFELFGLDISNVGKLPADRLFSWDQLEQLPEADAVIHLAGKAHDTSNTVEEAEYFKVNLGLTKRIFDYFLKSSATKFIFFSSVKAVADSVEGQILTEDAIPNPLTPYGKSKLAAEQYLWEKLEEWRNACPTREDGGGEEWRDTNPKSTKEVAFRNGRMEKQLTRKLVYILRPCMIHGPGNKGNLNLLYKVVQKGIPWPLGLFGNYRSFASIGNVSFVVRKLVEEPVSSGAFNIGDDEPLSTNELVKLIAESLGRKPKIWNLPKGFITALAKTGDVLKLPLNSERLKKLTESYVVSNQKIKSVLEIDKMPVSSTEGMMETLRSF
jgi:nucleoside-diphosphate-sugar epimerase